MGKGSSATTQTEQLATAGRAAVCAVDALRACISTETPLHVLRIAYERLTLALDIYERARFVPCDVAEVHEQPALFSEGGAR